MDGQIVIITFLTIVGLGCGVAIYLANKFLPEENEMLKKTEEIAQFLPGMNCGACGKPGCFAYAGEVAKTTTTFSTHPCQTFLNDEEAVKSMGDMLGMELSGGEKKIAIVHCAGDSDVLYEYEGVDTCKAARQLSGGYKQCSFACLGFGDCMDVCPVDAIHKDEQKRIVTIDPEACIGCGLCAKECPQVVIEIVPADMPQYLACNYTPRRDIPGREKCDLGCIHCRKCFKVSENGEVIWDKETFMPKFDHELLLPAPAAIEACPKDVILKRSSSKKWK